MQGWISDGLVKLKKPQGFLMITTASGRTISLP